ncbi:MAG TPA: AmmeMemoRadiSam system protein B, partial [Desulfatiglandales bacterium]|nr:AmmeMemoRadiSam system protein B [Desulfatiglandales bacterium]
QTAAYSYREIKGQHYDTVIILGPSHRVYIKGASVGNWDAYSTPLGKVAVNKEIVHALLDKGEDFRFVEGAHNREHSIETQLPFLQRVLGNFDIVPILMGASSLKDCEKISGILLEAAKNRNVLFVASSDMSHYPDYINANKVDQKTLSLIERGAPESVFNAEAEIFKQGVPNLSTTLCGLRAVVTVMMAVKNLGGNFSKILHYANSGDISIDGNQERRRVVGYGAVAFYKK